MTSKTNKQYVTYGRSALQRSYSIVMTQVYDDNQAQEETRLVRQSEVTARELIAEARITLLYTAISHVIIRARAIRFLQFIYLTLAPVLFHRRCWCDNDSFEVERSQRTDLQWS